MTKKEKETREKALKIVTFALKKKAQSPCVLKIKEISNFCDYFIVCSGESTPHVRAIYEEVVASSKKNAIAIHHTEKDEFSTWILIDFYDVVLHVFLDEVRKFFDLEHLWSEAKKIRFTKKNLE